MTTDRRREIILGSGPLRLPVFFPDATRAVLRSLDGDDLRKSKVEGVVVNAFHLLYEPGPSVIAELGGAGKYMGWDGPVVSDSGGFQLLSMIYRDKSLGTVSREGVVFHRKSGGERRKYSLTPEASIRIQFDLGANVMFCLDDCPLAGATGDALAASVGRTVEWAARCREEYSRQAAQRKIPEARKPLLFAVIQGGDDRNLRETCFRGLEKTGFDGYGFGGWPLDERGVVNTAILGFTAELVPRELPRFALGVGNPAAVVECHRLGYDMFDCSLPSRDARHKRLWVFASDPARDAVCGTMYIDREEYVRDGRPVSEFCDCHTCTRFSRAYLNHLFKIEDSLAFRLATMHNLRTYTRLMETLRTDG